MHIAAANPLALRGEELDPGADRARARDRRARRRPNRGKPADIVAKMVEGAMAKFRKENALLSQLFVIDNKTKVEDVVAAGGQGGRRADRAQGLCPLPARRRHREEGKRLRRRSRRRFGRRQARAASPNRAWQGGARRLRCAPPAFLIARTDPREPYAAPALQPHPAEAVGRGADGRGRSSASIPTPSPASPSEIAGGRRGRPSSSAWSSAAATSSAASPAPPRASTAPAPIIWACWRR